MNIASLIITIPAGKGLPVIFNGAEPRYLGRAHTHLQADALALQHCVSATYVSRAQVELDGGAMSEPFFILHDGVHQ